MSCLMSTQSPHEHDSIENWDTETLGINDLCCFYRWCLNFKIDWRFHSDMIHQTSFNIVQSRLQSLIKIFKFIFKSLHYNERDEDLTVRVDCCFIRLLHITSSIVYIQTTRWNMSSWGRKRERCVTDIFSEFFQFDSVAVKKIITPAAFSKNISTDYKRHFYDTKEFWTFSHPQVFLTSST